MKEVTDGWLCEWKSERKWRKGTWKKKKKGRRAGGRKDVKMDGVETGGVEKERMGRRVGGGVVPARPELPQSLSEPNGTWV